MMRDFRLYMLVGGMPQAVNAYLQTNDLAKVDEIKRNIINLYETDFYKIDPTGNASKLFHAIPEELSRNASRFFSLHGKQLVEHLYRNDLRLWQPCKTQWW